MTNIVTIRKLVDGPRHAILHAYLESDGSSGELSATVLVDASALSGAPTKLTVERVEGNLNGFEATLLFDATADVPFLTLPNAANGGQFAYKFQTHYGGIPDTSADGYTGDILITTNGFTAATDKGHIIITVRKD